MIEIVKNLVCDITENNINIKDSYSVTKKAEMKEILSIIKEYHPECKVFNVRTERSLVSEWRSHNRLYKLGIKRKQTGSTDLDVYEPKWRLFLYAIIGI